QQSKFPGNGCRVAFLFAGRRFSFKRKGSDIAIAKTTDLKLTPINRLEKGGVGRRPWIDGAHRPPFPPQGFADLLGPLKQRDFSLRRRKRRKIAEVGRAR